MFPEHFGFMEYFGFHGRFCVSPFMTTSKVSNGRIYFETSAGAKWSVPFLPTVGTVVRKVAGRLVYHELFELEDWEREEWPWATHRMSLTPFFEQSSPLFVSCPVGIKEGCKYQILLACGKEDSRHPSDQWKIDEFNVFEGSKVV